MNVLICDTHTNRNDRSFLSQIKAIKEAHAS